MNDQPPAKSSSGQGEFERKRLKHRIYCYRVTVMAILICGLLFLGGIWVSGIDLDQMMKELETFNSKNDLCLRSTWANTTQGEFDRIQLCTEWISQSDMSGKTHTVLVENLEIIKEPDGTIRTQLQRGINYQLIILSVYLVSIIWSARKIQRLFIERSRKQLGQYS